MFNKIVSILLLVSVIISCLFIPAVSASKETWFLVDIGIMEPDVKTGLFETNYSREKFAKTLVKMLADSEPAAMSENLAADIEKSSLKNYINYAIMTGLMKVDNEGKFKPNGNVTKTDAVCSLLKVLEYDETAESRGGKDSDYLLVAGNIGLLNNVSIKDENQLVYSEIAQLVSNAMDIRPKVKSNEVLKDRKPTLFERKNIEKESGRILANSSFGIETQKTSKNHVNIDGTIFLTNIIIEDYMIGTFVNYYIKEIDGEWTVVSLKERKSTDRVTINANDINNIDFNDSYITINYKNNKEIYIDYKAYLMLNGKSTSVSKEIFKAFKCGTITAVQTDNNLYDVLHMNVLKTEIIDGISYDNYSFVTKYSKQRIDLNRIKDDIEVYSKGKISDFSKIKPDSVVSIACDSFSIVNDNIVFDYSCATSVKLYLGKDQINGTVEAVNNSDDAVTIDDFSYLLSPYFKSLIDSSIKQMFKVGKTYKIYLDYFDSVTDYIIDSATYELKYGYVLQGKYVKSGVQGSLELKILTDNDKIIIYPVKKKFVLNGIANIESNKEVYDNVDLTKRQVIRYSVYNGCITEIVTVKQNSELTLDLAKLRRYCSSKNFLRRAVITDKSVIFVDGGDEGVFTSDIDFQTLSFSNVTDGYYTMEGYNLNEMNEIGCAVLYQETGKELQYTEQCYMVSKISQAVNTNGDIGFNLELYGANTQVSGFAAEDRVRIYSAAPDSGSSSLTLTKEKPENATSIISPGDIVRIRRNLAKEISHIEIIFKYSPNAADKVYIDTEPKWNFSYGILNRATSTYLSYNHMDYDLQQGVKPSDAYIVAPSNRCKSIPVFDTGSKKVKVVNDYTSLPSYANGRKAKLFTRSSYQEVYDIFVYLYD